MKTIRILSAVILLVVGINALLAGASFMSDPSGTGLHISASRLRHSPFNDYFIPGLVLFVVNGILNLTACLFIFLRWKPYVFMLLIQSVLLSGWIFIQVLMLREFNFLHALFGGIGILLFAFAWYLNRHEKNSLN